jgi:hypothetical protein
VNSRVFRSTQREPARVALFRAITHGDREL